MFTIDQQADATILRGVQADMAHCDVAVRDDLIDAHALVLTRLALPGTWFTGAERVAIAAAARTAQDCDFCVERKAALSPYSIDGVHKAAPGHDILPAALVDMVHLIINDAPRMTEAAIARLADSGLSDAHFVEALGIAVAIRSIDQACRGLGVPQHALPAPVDGDPSRIRPDIGAADIAFVPMMPNRQPDPPHDDLWGDVTGNALRALSLVPDAVRDTRILSQAQYVPLDQGFDMGFGRTLGREQMELLAARTSAMNDCFY